MLYNDLAGGDFMKEPGFCTLPETPYTNHLDDDKSCLCSNERTQYNACIVNLCIW